jgi:ADP-ribosyltransferase exoenzyme
MCQSLSSDEIDALQRYKTANNNDDCWELKANLRSGIGLEDLPYGQKCTAKLIDSALSKPCPINEETTVYRGLTNTLNLTDKEISDARFRTKDYWGCSTEKTEASGFVSGADGGSLLIIRVTPGCRILNLESSRANITLFGEREVLLPRNLKMQIEKIENHKTYEVALDNDPIPIDTLKNLTVYCLTALPEDC